PAAEATMPPARQPASPTDAHGAGLQARPESRDHPIRRTAPFPPAPSILAGASLDWSRHGGRHSSVTLLGARHRRIDSRSNPSLRLGCGTEFAVLRHRLAGPIPPRIEGLPP